MDEMLALTLIGIIITYVGLIVGIIALYLQRKSLLEQLEFKDDINKTMNTQIRLQKKAIREFKKGRTPSEVEIRQKDEELKIKQQRETRLQVQTGWKIFKEITKK